MLRIFNPYKDSVLYHLHIPKTAGTTVHGMLQSQFAPERVASVDPTQVIKQSPEQLAAYDFFSGHLEFGYYLPQLTERRVETIVFLRHPHKVLASMFRQVLQTPDDPIHAHVMQNCPTLESFLFDPFTSEYIRNPQTRYLGLAERRFTPQTVARLQQSSDQLQWAQCVQDANDEAALISDRNIRLHAHKRLQQCDVVGIVEHMDESLRRVCKLRNWKPFDQIQSLNVSDTTIATPVQYKPHVVKRLDQLCEQDTALYYAAMQIFDRVTATNKLLYFWRGAA